jgi:para-aminobenzoate synthetase
MGGAEVSGVGTTRLAYPASGRATTPVRTLLVDNHDSYTYNLAQQLAVVNGIEPTVVTNDEISWREINALDIHNVVISPGPGRPERPEDFRTCGNILRQAVIPILGVCLGHQGLAVAYGGRTVPAPVVMHGRLSRIRHDGELFRDLPQNFPVVRYHSLMVAEPLPEGLIVTARAEDGTVMGLAALDRPFYGVQFHPESVLTSHGSTIIERFRELTVDWWRRHGARPEPAPGAPPRQETLRLPARTRWWGAPADAGARTTPPVTVRPVAQRLTGPFDAELVFQAVRGSGPAVWLDSAARGHGTGRFSYLTAGSGPLAEVVRYTAGRRVVRVRRPGEPGGEEVHPDTGIFEFLANRLATTRCVDANLPFDFVGGYVGWFGYECRVEATGPIPHTAPTDDAALLFADRLVVIDHDTDDIYLVALAGPDGEQAARTWMSRTSDLLRPLRARSAPEPDAHRLNRPVLARPDRDRRQYYADIERCRELLRTGDTYEVCLTNQFRMPAVDDPFETYRRLRRNNPAPFAAFLDIEGTQVCSSSPERFLRIDRDGWAEAKPIKGTARRHEDPAEDARAAHALACDPKERAENLMIVDLLRNDLGRVCQVGSVEVPSLMAIETFRTVHQMVSTVRGRIRSDLTVADCVKWVFPGGSMTGAPKIRTMQIIDEIEKASRGVYSGSIGYFGCDGSIDLSIVIRTLVHHRGEVTVGAGGAITILSDPEREWQEVLLKAGAVLKAVNARIGEEVPA